MAFQVLMPKLSDAMTEGGILQWIKKEGDRVQGGDVLASIETDKAEIELESFGAGVLRKILVAEGDTVPVGKLIAIVAEPDEDITSLLAGAPAATPAAPPKSDAKAPSRPAAAPGPPPAPAKAEAKTAPPTAPPKVEAKTPAAAPSAAPESGWIPASPIARRMARDAGIDLSKISGSGPGGRILERDVEAHVAAQAQRLGGADVPTGAREFEDKELSTIRKTIASRMVQSKSPIPHFTVTVEADMGAAEALRKSLNAIEAGAEKLSI